MVMKPQSLSCYTLSDIYANHLQKSHSSRCVFGGKSIHAQIVKLGLDMGVFLTNSLMNFYVKTGFLSDARQVFDEMPVRTTFSWNTILSAYAKKGRFDEALRIFYEIPQRDSVSWTVMVVGYNQMSRFSDAIRMFLKMISDKAPMTQFVSTNILASCAGIGASDIGKKVHSLVVKNGLSGYVSVANSLLNMYAKFGDVVKAEAVFEGMRVKNRSSWNSLMFLHMRRRSFDVALSLFREMNDRDVVSWNAIISGYNQSGCDAEALSFFSDMLKDSSVRPDKFTFSSVLSSCGNLSKLSLGKQIHARILSHELETSVALVNALISMYAKCGEVKGAKKVLEENQFSNHNVVAFTAILDGYVKLGDVNPARKLFDSLAHCDVVTWTAMIVGYLKNGLNDKALELFRSMLRRGPKPNPYTLSAILSVCSTLTSLGHGKEIHASAIRSGVASSVSVSNALITMYAQSGSIDVARRTFSELAPGKRDTVSWTSMIVSLARHGLGDEAIELFETMIDSGAKPDHITYVGVLSACTHNGLVEKGRKYFNLMKNSNEIELTMSHYACMIDLLGRAGLLQEAFDFIRTMPIEPDVEAWGSLLSSCKVHKNAELAKVATERLLLIEPENGGAYSTLASLYSACGKWEESANVRRSMKDLGVKKDKGLSWF